ncbi:MAG: flagellar filament capping protein FliD, partial [Gemmatimonadetes bacterium]|nr:flagellar filament capping protein FliD [Gemmatimonadota bacterium]
MTSPISSSSLGLGSLAPTSPSSTGSAQPIASINGIASGIQWQGMVDQIMQVEQATELDPVTAKENAAQAQSQAWTTFQGVLGKFRDAANALGASSAFDVYTATADKSPTSSRDLISATATTGASTGTFSAEVLQLARAEKIGGNVVADSSAALNISGQFAINGVTITVAATDSLSSIRDKINAADSGTAPSGVTATILAAGSGSQLVLTSDTTGSAGIQTIDDAAGTLGALGFADGTAVANIASSGATQTNRMWSATSSIGSLIGLTMPAASTIKVGGQVISVDLSTDSLQSIASKINTALGSTTAATVVSETVGTRTAYRLQTSATVETDASVNAAASAQILATLGFTNEGRSGTTASVGSANLFNDASTSAAVTTATALSQLQIGTQSLGLATGDVVTIAGTRGDGTAVSTTYTVGGASTMQDLLNAINNTTNGFGSGTRTATASLNAGRIVLTDGTAGASQLGLSLTVARASGGTISLGTFGTATGGTAGRSRELVSGTDAKLRIDGQTVTRSTNTISDAITGVTLNLLGAEPGTAVNVNIAHDINTITQTIQTFVTAYNNVRTWVTQNTATGAPLANDTTARSMAQSLTTALLNNVVGATGSLTTAAIAGLQHDKTGVLSLDTTTFQGFANTNFDDLRRLFSMSGVPSDPSITFISAGPNAKATATPYPVVITQAATLGSVTGAIWSTYATTGAPDTMTITDASTGYSGSVSLTNGDSIDTTIAHLNSMFGVQKMRLTASKTADSRIQITSLDYGTTGGFKVAYTPGAGGDGTAALGIAATSYAGLDVAGTINGVAGTGKGQYRTGAVGDASESIV